MQLRDGLIFLAISSLSFSGLYFGWRFLKLRNVLLGLEWLILGASAANMFVLYATGWPANEFVMYLLDSFSRSVGIPIIGTVGLLKLLRDYEPSKPVEIATFLLGLVLALFLITSEPLQPYLPWSYWTVGLLFQAALISLAGSLFRAGAKGHGIAIVCASITLSTIALLEGIVEIPDDERNLFLNFYFIAHIGWALSFAEIYWAYAALLKTRQRNDGLQASLESGQAGGEQHDRAPAAAATVAPLGNLGRPLDTLGSGSADLQEGAGAA